MKRTGMKMMALIAFAALVPVSGWGYGGSGRKQGPPSEAVSACEGKKAGESAEFTNRRGEKVRGICTEVDGRLVARKEGGNKTRGGKGMKECRKTDEDSRRVPRLAAALGLSEIQQKKVGAILEAEQARIAPIRAEMVQNKGQLRAAVHSGADEATIRTLSEAQQELRTRILVSRAQGWREINALLTPEQQAKAQTLAAGEKKNRGSCRNR